MFVVQSKDRETQACIGGELTVEMDREKIQQLLEVTEAK